MSQGKAAKKGVCSDVIAQREMIKQDIVCVRVLSDCEYWKTTHVDSFEL